MYKYRNIRFILLSLLMGMMISCSSSKFIPKGNYLLDKVEVTCSNSEVNTSTLEPYIRQTPNSRWFSLVKVPLGIYSISGRDSSKWINKFFRRIGEAPIVYDEQSSKRSATEIKNTLQNIGYQGATVDIQTEYHKHKVKVVYKLNPGNIYKVNSIKYDIADTTLIKHLTADQSLLNEGMVLNIKTLDEERNRIVERLQNAGYYKFSKEYITYTADTVKGTFGADLTMHISAYKKDKNQLIGKAHPIYKIGDIKFITEFDVSVINENKLKEFNTQHHNGIDFYYKDKLFLRKSILANNCFIEEGKTFHQNDIKQTYQSLARLHALKYTNIHFFEREDSVSRTPLLDTYILTSKAKDHNISFEVEGTNTAGDFGAAASISYQHKNLFKGSELFTFRVRGAYEAISELQGYSIDNYKEYGVETKLNFPRFVFPFLSHEFKRKIRATSEVGIQFNAQERPEFSRQVATISWSYRWSQQQNMQHKIDIPDINYVYMPSISPTFKEQYLNNIASNSILKYNYEDLFIAKIGYSFSYSSTGLGYTPGNKTTNFSLRFNIEESGNLLNAISHTLYKEKNSNNQYAIGNIAYAQYVKSDIDFTQNIQIDKRNSIAMHLGLGIAYPYGNSTILPFEKRYFSGGANSVRGWSVRSLGPGSYRGNDKKIDFINQSGDVKLDLNIEYRTTLFWKLNGAVFIDAGNIWTLREYEEQPGGAFRLNKFFNQIAVAYGLGFRLNLDYFILRFDGGMKAINPAYSTDNRNHYPITHPDFNRDFTFHFAVGYPF